MQRYTGELKRSEFRLREHLTALERDWLRGCLASNVGVQRAVCSDEDPHQIVVEYDTNVISSTDLLNILYLSGLRVDVRF